MALDMQTQMRLTGMASGLDTDAVIQNLGKVHTLRINKVKQDKQLAVWRQEMYRDTISKLTNFMKSNLNISNPTSNFRSSAAFAKFTYNLTGTIGGIDASKLMSVTANGDLRNFSQTVQGVAQLATKDTWTGVAMGLQGIKTTGFDYAANFGVVDLGNGSIGMQPPTYAVFGISIDGTSKTLTIPPEKILDAAWGGKYITEFSEGSRLLTGADKTFAVDHFVHGVAAVNGNPVYVRDGAGDYKAVDSALFDSIIVAAGLGTTFDDSEEHQSAIRDYFANTKIFGAAGDKDDLVSDFVDGNFGGGGLYYVYQTGEYVEVDDVLLDSIVGGSFSSSNPAHIYAVEDYFNNHAIFTDSGILIDTTESFANLLNEEIAKQFGSSYSDIVSAEGDQLKFHKSGSNITLFEVTGFSTLKNWGLEGGASTSGAVNNKKIGDVPDGLFPPSINEATIKINGVEIKLSRNDTIANVMAKINGSDAGVTLSYNSAADKFTLTSKLEGTANNINFDGYAALLFTGLKILDINNAGEAFDRKEAQNFIGIINGEEFVRQSNTFTHEGMTYTFNKTFNATIDDLLGSPTYGKAIAGPEDPIKIEVSKNTDEIITGIKAFIEEYNNIVTHINDLLNGKRDRDYPPLTEDERKAMSEAEVKLYEDKAKIGLMANDSQLRKLLSDMRTSIYQKVEGVGLTMTDIGITTTANYKDGGLLVINEEKLKTALENNYDGVVSLFTKSSSIPSSEKDSAKLAQRYSESGIAQRLNDILISAAGTSTGGDKGYLLTKAGMVNDRTQYDNSLTKQINEYDKKIDTLLERWYRQENAYYAMFARMETAMAKLQAQQNSLAQIMAQSGS